MAESITVNLSDCEYDCGLCEAVHKYSDEDGFYTTHMDLRTGNKRWLYAEVLDELSE